jgi:hypothetical protein
LTQFEYLQQASGPDRQEFNAALKKWVDRLAQNRKASSRNAVEELMRYVREYDDWPIELRQAFAKLVYGIITDQPSWASIDDYFSLTDSEAREFQDGGAEIVPPYDKRYVAAARKRMQYFLDEWPALVNQSLEQRFRQESGPNTAEIIRSLESVLSVYSDGDTWPVDQSAALLTARLVDRLLLDPSLAERLGFDTSAELMAQIVHITGKIPDVARTTTPQQGVADKLKDFEAFLAGEREKFTPDALNHFAGLYEWVPLEVIKLSLGEAKKAPIQGRRGVYTDALTPRFILALASTGGSGHMVRVTGSDAPGSAVDPLLLLAALSNLTGVSETQDARIATLLGEERTGWVTLSNDFYDQSRAAGLKVHLKNLLASPLKARFHARRMLDEMAAKSKSQALIDAIKAYGPAEPEATRAAGDNRSSSAESSDRLYKGTPESQ